MNVHKKATIVMFCMMTIFFALVMIFDYTITGCSIVNPISVACIMLMLTCILLIISIVKDKN